MSPVSVNGTPPAELKGWKEIAKYLAVSLRTAQVWEDDFHLPVHRIGGDRGTVFAIVSELEEWKAARGSIVVRTEADALNDLRRDYTDLVKKVSALKWALAVLGTVAVAAVALLVVANFHVQGKLENKIAEVAADGAHVSIGIALHEQKKYSDAMRSCCRSTTAGPATRSLHRCW
jgi:hypothetical protein